MPEFKQLRDDISALPTAAQQLVVDFLENELFIGMWSERPEMQDSTAWVRQTRQQHWRT